MHVQSPALAVPDRKRLVIVVGADPIISGHSTEARNLAEAARDNGFDEVRIITYPLSVIAASDLPLKPPRTVQRYSRGIKVLRPAPVGDSTVLDGRIIHGMVGELIDILCKRPALNYVMNLHLMPHGQIVMQAVQTARCIMQRRGLSWPITTIAEAVGSDITGVVRGAVADGNYGAAAHALDTYLRHDVPVAVSHFTKRLIFEAAAELDQRLGTTFAKEIEGRVTISYPSVNADAYTCLGEDPTAINMTMRKRRLSFGDYILFLSRLARAKGADDLIHAYRRSREYGRKTLVIAGTGPALEGLQRLAGEDPHIRFFTDITDREKGRLMHAAGAYVLPSKPSPESIATFGISIVEKMLAGGPGPVITTRTGGIPEATGDHCYYVPAGDPVALAARLDEVAGLPRQTIAELNKQAQQYAMQFDRTNILLSLVGSHRLRQAS